MSFSCSFQYLFDLLVYLRKSGYGATIGDMCVGGIAYADDVTLVSPMRYGMQKRLDACFLFAEESRLLF